MTTTYPERTWTHEGRPELHRMDLNGRVHRPAEPGPWWSEPDKVQWVDAASGYDALAVRQHFGAWCGYVGLPVGHPWRGEDAQHLLDAVDVHGGITYGPAACDEGAPDGHGICHAPYPGRPHDVAWVGFDTGHAWDYMPGMAILSDRELFRGTTYRDLDYIRTECARLATQAAAATSIEETP